MQPFHAIHQRENKTKRTTICTLIVSKKKKFAPISTEKNIPSPSIHASTPPSSAERNNLT